MDRVAAAQASPSDGDDDIVLAALVARAPVARAGLELDAAELGEVAIRAVQVFLADAGGAVLVAAVGGGLRAIRGEWIVRRLERARRRRRRSWWLLTASPRGPGLFSGLFSGLSCGTYRCRASA